MSGETSAPVDAGSSRPVPLGSGRGGPVRRALAKVLTEARDLGRMTALDELTALLAVRLADVVDRSARDGDAHGMTRAATQLEDVIKRLPIGAPGGESAGSGDGGGERGRVLALLDGPPTVGDAANS